MVGEIWFCVTRAICLSALFSIFNILYFAIEQTKDGEITL